MAEDDTVTGGSGSLLEKPVPYDLTRSRHGGPDAEASRGSDKAKEAGIA